MCDTFFISSENSAEGFPILCKNSDRPIGESQGVIFISREDYEKKESFSGDREEIKVTYISVLRWVRRNDVVLGRPSWMWGAEMGVSSSGVAIGNEAIFTKNLRGKRRVKGENNGLLGMDVLRIALESSRSSSEAVDTIIQYIEMFGQDVNSAFDKDFRYYNSFLVADKSNSAFYIETVGRYWAVKKLSEFYAVSNEMLIEDDYDRISDELITLKNQRNLGVLRDNKNSSGDSVKFGDRAKSKSESESEKEAEKIKSKMKTKSGDFNFKRNFEDRIYTFFTGASLRRRKVLDELEKRKKVSALDCFEILKTHNFVLGKLKVLSIPSKNTSSLCMHSEGFLSPTETANSMVAVLRDSIITAWFTGTPHACLSVFKPLFIPCSGNGNKKREVAENKKSLQELQNLSPSLKYNFSLWWIAYEVHSLALWVFQDMLESLKRELEEIQLGMIELEKKVISGIMPPSFEIFSNGVQKEIKVLLKYREKMVKYNFVKKLLVPFFKRPLSFAWRAYHNRKYIGRYF